MAARLRHGEQSVDEIVKVQGARDGELVKRRGRDGELMRLFGPVALM
jgi:hypothetical protein